MWLGSHGSHQNLPFQFLLQILKVCVLNFNHRFLPNIPYLFSKKKYQWSKYLYGWNDTLWDVGPYFNCGNEIFIVVRVYLSFEHLETKMWQANESISTSINLIVAIIKTNINHNFSQFFIEFQTCLVIISIGFEGSIQSMGWVKSMEAPRGIGKFSGLFWLFSFFYSRDMQPSILY